MLAKGSGMAVSAASGISSYNVIVAVVLVGAMIAPLGNNGIFSSHDDNGSSFAGSPIKSNPGSLQGQLPGRSSATVDPSGSSPPGPNEIGSWSSSLNTLSYSTYANRLVSYNGWILSVGGYATTSVYKAQVQSGGDITGWSLVTALPASRGYLGAVAYNSKIYAVGGSSDAGSTLYNTVYYNDILGNGDLGATWQPATTLPYTWGLGELALCNGYLYAIGGVWGSATGPSNNVYYTSLVGGVPQGWTQTTGLPSAKSRISFDNLVYNNRIYVPGGSDGTGGLYPVYPHTSVYYASCSPTGGISAWEKASYDLPEPRHRLTAALDTSNGELYVIGGNDGTSYLASTRYARIDPNTGDLAGAWTNGPDLPISQARAYAGAVFTPSKSTIHVVAGTPDGSTSTNTVFYAKTPPEPAVLSSPADFMKGGPVGARPSFYFYSRYPDGRNIRYQIEISTDPNFGSTVVSATSGTNPGFYDTNSPGSSDPFVPSHVIRFTVQIDLTPGTTYWWHVRATEVGGYWSQYSSSRSYTVSLPSGIYRAWNYNRTGELEGWTVSSGISGLSVSGDAMQGSTTNTDPTVQMASAMTGYSGASYPYVIVRAKMNAGAHDSEIFYAINGGGFVGGQEKLVSKTYDGVSYQTLVFDFSADAVYMNGANSITLLRFDPTTASGDTFYADYIWVSSTSNPKVYFGESWFQTTKPQFDRDTLGSTAVTTPYGGGDAETNILFTDTFSDNDFTNNPTWTINHFWDNVENGVGTWSAAEQCDYGGVQSPFAITTPGAGYYKSATQAWWVDDPSTNATETLASPSISIPAGATSPQLRFWHRMNSELDAGGLWDVGWLQYKIGAGAWTSALETDFAKGGYNSPLVSNGVYCAPLADASAVPPSTGTNKVWGGLIGASGPTQVIFNIPAGAIGSTIQFRFGYQSDSNTGAAEPNGWWLDDFEAVASGGSWTAASGYLADTAATTSKISTPLSLDMSSYPLSWEFKWRHETVDASSSTLRFYLALNSPDTTNVAGRNGYFFTANSNTGGTAMVGLYRQSGASTLCVIDCTMGGWAGGAGWHTGRVTRTAAGSWQLFVDGGQRGSAASDVNYLTGSFVGLRNTPADASHNVFIDDIYVNRTDATTGTVTTPTINYADGPADRVSWSKIVWSRDVTAGSATVAVQKYTSSWIWAGIQASTSPIDITSLDSMAQIRLVSNLSYSGGTPKLLDWEVVWTRNNPPTLDSLDVQIGGVTQGDNAIVPAGKSVDFVMNVSDAQGSADIDYVELKLDGTDNYKVKWTDATDQFSIVSGGSCFSLLSNDQFSNATGNKWTLRFRLVFTWTCVIADVQYDPVGYAMDNFGDSKTKTFTDRTYLIENDLVFSGTLVATAQIQGVLTSGVSWVRGGETITWTGLTVYYQGTTITPLDKDFNITIKNNDGTTWKQTTGAVLSLVTTAGPSDDPSDTHYVNITDVPGGGPHGSQSFIIKIDASPPTLNYNSKLYYGPYSTDPGKSVDVDFSDSGSGLDKVEYRLPAVSGAWTTLWSNLNGAASKTDNFDLWNSTPIGNYSVEYRVTDMLGYQQMNAQMYYNVTEATRTISLYQGANFVSVMVTRSNFGAFQLGKDIKAKTGMIPYEVMRWNSSAQSWGDSAISTDGVSWFGSNFSISKGDAYVVKMRGAGPWPVSYGMKGRAICWPVTVKLTRGLNMLSIPNSTRNYKVWDDDGAGGFYGLADEIVAQNPGKVVLEVKWLDPATQTYKVCTYNEGSGLWSCSGADNFQILSGRGYMLLMKEAGSWPVYFTPT